MKNMIKLVIEHFFIITVGVLFFTSIGNLKVESFPASYPWIVLLTGVVGAVPTFLFYFKNEPTKKQFITRAVIHFFVIEALIMFEGWILGWYSSFLEGLVIFAMILAVYVFVWFFSYRLNISLANDINDAIDKINDDE